MDWRDKAECRDMDPDLFFPKTVKEFGLVVGVCMECPVKLQCLKYAETRDRLDDYPLTGVWGGRDFSKRWHERYRSKHRRKQ
ncbi:WhiB family transcriptional regulator [Bifidobacterium olomucense]|uniref:Transcription factor WhiB n=1 Tax=Bifidobacterium olomucense TaxID=2675324 RepID=A0A7Y0HWX0_9BIFI|nr:transcription factor WhiB [Bifidobacterium sp. DSM 109959]